MGILKAQNLVKQYQNRALLAKKRTKKRALSGVSFTLTPGLYGLLGPNGAGKSTPTSILSPVEFDSANTFMEKLFDNHLIITRYIPGDKPEDRVVEENAVDTDTGLISSLTLQYHNEGRLDPVNIVCENDIEFLVVNGTDSSNPMDTFQKAFIAKEDDWNGIPNYTPITH